MADERFQTREWNWHKYFPFLHLFRTFLVAIDPFKLLIAAAGILTMAVGWFFLSVLFYNLSSGAPKKADFDVSAYQKEGMEYDEAEKLRDADYLKKLSAWSLRHQLAGPTGITTVELLDGSMKDYRGGKYRVMPWFEDRGPNPVSLVKNTVSGSRSERSETIGAFLQGQVFILVEPLLKFLTPITFLFDSRADLWTRLYLVVLLLWELAVWGFFGGIITRLAVSSFSGKETGGLQGAIQHVRKFYPSYLASPIVPIGVLFAMVIGCGIFGALHLLPIFGDIIVDGLFWVIPLAAGFLMTLLVLGLIGYPLMYPILSAEGSDTYDSLSRSYNYVYESPWSYLWYGLVSVFYGAILVFFVVVVTSLTVYLAKWGVNQTPLTETFNRTPHYLYTYAPTSFGWRQLLLEGTPLETFNDQYVNPAAAKQYLSEYRTWNTVGAGMVSFWLTALFMLMLGFSYSYFWTSSSMIYLLMRKKVDETEIDEIYQEDNFLPPTAPPPPPAAPKEGIKPLNVVDAPKEVEKPVETPKSPEAPKVQDTAKPAEPAKPSEEKPKDSDKPKES